jgi:hypothetical protein
MFAGSIEQGAMRCFGEIVDGLFPIDPLHHVDDDEDAFQDNFQDALRVISSESSSDAPLSDHMPIQNISFVLEPMEDRSPSVSPTSDELRLLDESSIMEDSTVSSYWDDTVSFMTAPESPCEGTREEEGDDQREGEHRLGDTSASSPPENPSSPNPRAKRSRKSAHGALVESLSSSRPVYRDGGQVPEDEGEVDTCSPPHDEHQDCRRRTPTWDYILTAGRKRPRDNSETSLLEYNMGSAMSRIDSALTKHRMSRSRVSPPLEIRDVPEVEAVSCQMSVSSASPHLERSPIQRYRLRRISGGNTPGPNVLRGRSRAGGSPDFSLEDTVFAGLEDSSTETLGNIKPPAQEVQIPLVPSWAARYMSQMIVIAFAQTRVLAAIVLQRHIRGYMGRSLTRIRLDCLDRDTAALAIQDAWCTSRTRQRRRQRSDAAAWVIQDAWFDFQSRQRRRQHSLLPPKTSEEVPEQTESVVQSTDGFEVFFGTWEPVKPVQSPSELQTEGLPADMFLPCELQRSGSLCSSRPTSIVLPRTPSDDDDEEDDMDLYLNVVAADGAPSHRNLWTFSPPRRQFWRSESIFSPTLSRINEEDTNTSSISVASDEESSVYSLLSNSGDTVDQELAMYGGDCADSKLNEFHLMSPPRLCHRTETPIALDLFLVQPLESSSRPNDSSTNDFEDRSSQEVFGILELVLWLQTAVRRHFYRKRYTLFRASVTILQDRFRYQQLKKHREVEHAITMLQRWHRRRVRKEQQVLKEQTQVASSPTDEQPFSHDHCFGMSRPPVYPTKGLPHPTKPAMISDADKQSPPQLECTTDIDIFDSIGSSESAPAVTWPVPCTHYHHMTQPLVVKKVISLSPFELKQALLAPREIDESQPPTGRKACNGDTSSWLDTLFSLQERIERNSELSAVVRMQSSCRKYLAIKRAAALRGALLRIQSHSRSSRARRDYLACIQKVLLLQKQARSFLNNRKFTPVRLAFLLIQRRYRGHRCRVQQIQIIEATQLIQRRFRVLIRRKMLLRKLYCARQRFVASCTIQSTSRRWLAHKHFQSMLQAASRVQKNLCGSMCRVAYQRFVQSVVVLQKHFRQRKALGIFKSAVTAIFIIQTSYRGYKKRQTYHAVRKAVFLLQAHARALIRFRMLRMKLFGARQRSAAAVVIESVARGHLVRNHYRRICAAVRILQRSSRAHLEKEKCSTPTERVTATLLQQSFRGCTDRNERRVSHSAAAAIQKVTRGAICRRLFLQNQLEARHRLRLMQAICVASAQRESDETCISPAFPFNEDQPKDQTLDLDAEFESKPYGRSTCRSSYISGRSKLASQIFYLSILSIIVSACICNYPLMRVQPAHANHKSTFELQLRAMHSQAWRAGERDEILKRVATSLEFQPFTLASEYSREKKHFDQAKVNARSRVAVKPKQKSPPSNAVATLDDPSRSWYTSHISALETAARFQALMQLSSGPKAAQHPSRTSGEGVDLLPALPSPPPVSSWSVTPTSSSVAHLRPTSPETGKGLMFWTTTEDCEAEATTTAETANATEAALTTSEDDMTSDDEEAFKIAKNPAVAYMVEWKLVQFSA